MSFHTLNFWKKKLSSSKKRMLVQLNSTGWEQIRFLRFFRLHLLINLEVCQSSVVQIFSLEWRPQSLIHIIDTFGYSTKCFSNYLCSWCWCSFFLSFDIIPSSNSNIAFGSRVNCYLEPILDSLPTPNHFPEQILNELIKSKYLVDIWRFPIIPTFERAMFFSLLNIYCK